MNTPLLRKYFKSIGALCPAPSAVMLALVTVTWPAGADEPPDFTVQPQSLALIASEDAQFSVSASGTEPMAYQWRFNGENIGGATEASNVVNNVQSYNAGDYVVVVTNAFGAVTSAVATLTVEYPRVLVDPADAWVSVADGGVGGSVSFSVAPLPHPPLGYQWRFNGADIKFETSSNLVVRIQSVTNVGEYSVFVRTVWGGAEGPPTRLEVLSVKAAREQWRTNLAAAYSIVKLLSDDDGNLYLAANSWLAGFKVVKLDKAGHFLWTSNFATPLCNCDEVSDMTLDAQGNVYVTGYTPLNAAGTEQGYLTVKFNAAGSNCWSAIYYGVPRPGGRSSFARGVVVDAAGEVYVTGASAGTNTSYANDLATVKYDRDGNQVWVRRYDSGQQGDSGYAIALDSQTNVIATGEFATFKYDRDGNQLWRGEGYGQRIVIDRNDDIFVADQRVQGGGIGYVPLMKLSKTNGQLLATTSLPGYSPSLVDLVTDRQGHVAVIGMARFWSEYDAYNIVVHSPATVDADEWNDRFPGYAYAGAADRRGSVYVVGAGQGSNCRVVKWNSQGRRAWVLDPPGFANGGRVVVDKEFNLSVANTSAQVINYEQKHRLHILGFQPNGHFRLTLTGEPRVPVWLKASTNLWDWQNLSTLQFSVATADYTDGEAGSLPHRFYRTESVAPPAP